MKKLIIILIILTAATVHAEYTKVVWDGVDNANGYRVYTTNTETNETEQYQTSATEYMLADMSLLENVRYEIRVSGYNNKGEGSKSKSVYYHSKMPLPPTNLRIIYN